MAKERGVVFLDEPEQYEKQALKKYNTEPADVKLNKRLDGIIITLSKLTEAVTALAEQKADKPKSKSTSK